MQKIVSGIELNQPEEDDVEIGVELPPDSPLLNSFVILIVGIPGSGKSHLLKEMVKNDKLYKRKFEQVVIISPSKIKGLELEFGEDWYSQFSIDWIYQKIAEFKLLYFNKEGEFTYHKKVNILFVIDDVVAEIKKQQNDDRLKKMIWNRRHFFDDKEGRSHGTVSFIFTTQKYTTFPPTLRSNLNGLIFFKVPTNDYKIIKEEYYSFNPKVLDFIVNICFKEKHNFIYIKTQLGLVHVKFDQVVI